MGANASKSGSDERSNQNAASSVLGEPIDELQETNSTDTSIKSEESDEDDSASQAIEEPRHDVSNHRGSSSSENREQDADAQDTDSGSDVSNDESMESARESPWLLESDVVQPSNTNQSSLGPEETEISLPVISNSAVKRKRRSSSESSFRPYHPSPLLQRDASGRFLPKPEEELTRKALRERKRREENRKRVKITQALTSSGSKQSLPVPEGAQGGKIPAQETLDPGRQEKKNYGDFTTHEIKNSSKKQKESDNASQNFRTVSDAAKRHTVRGQGGKFALLPDDKVSKSALRKRARRAEIRAKKAEENARKSASRSKRMPDIAVQSENDLALSKSIQTRQRKNDSQNSSSSQRGEVSPTDSKGSYVPSKSLSKRQADDSYRLTRQVMRASETPDSKTSSSDETQTESSSAESRPSRAHLDTETHLVRDSPMDIQSDRSLSNDVDESCAALLRNDHGAEAFALSQLYKDSLNDESSMELLCKLLSTDLVAALTWEMEPEAYHHLEPNEQCQWQKRVSEAGALAQEGVIVVPKPTENEDVDSKSTPERQSVDPNAPRLRPDEDFHPGDFQDDIMSVHETPENESDGMELADQRYQDEVIRKGHRPFRSLISPAVSKSSVQMESELQSDTDDLAQGEQNDGNDDASDGNTPKLLNAPLDISPVDSSELDDPVNKSHEVLSGNDLVCTPDESSAGYEEPILGPIAELDEGQMLPSSLLSRQVNDHRNVVSKRESSNGSDEIEVELMGREASKQRKKKKKKRREAKRKMKAQKPESVETENLYPSSAASLPPGFSFRPILQEPRHRRSSLDHHYNNLEKKRKFQKEGSPMQERHKKRKQNHSRSEKGGSARHKKPLKTHVKPTGREASPELG